MSDEPNESGQSKTKLTKLTESGSTNDYAQWSKRAKVRLRKLNLWEYIEGEKSTPPLIPELVEESTYEALLPSGETITAVKPGNKAEVEKLKEDAKPWLARDLQALDLIVEAVPNRMVNRITAAKTAKEAWDILGEEYNPVNVMRSQVLYQHITAFKCTPEMDVNLWVDRIRELYMELNDQDDSLLPDHVFARTIANLVPTSALWLAWSAKMVNELNESAKVNKPISSTIVIQKIKAEYWAHQANTPNMTAQIYGSDSLKRRLTSEEAAPIGMTATTTPKRQRVDKSNLRCVNTYCEHPIGHTIDNCLSFGGGKCGAYKSWWRGRRDIHLPPNQRAPRTKGSSNISKTFNQPNNATTPTVNTIQTSPVSAAGGSGGASRRTESQLTDTRRDTTAQNTTSYAAVGNASVAPDFYCLNSFTTDLTVCNSEALQPSNDVTPDIFHDSGANHHIFADITVFRDYTATPPLPVHGFGTDLSSLAVGVGSVCLQTVCSGKEVTVQLSDVLHVPSARMNLVSQGCLKRHGMACRTDNGTMFLSMSGKDIITGTLQTNNLFRLDVKALPRSLAQRINPVIAASTEKKVTADFYTAY